jgi:hypothetical protein
MKSYNSYGPPHFRQHLFDSVQDRNRTFGYNKELQQRLQNNYRSSYFNNQFPGQQGCNTSQDVSTAPKNYYFNLKTDINQKTIIGQTHLRPNIYNDNVLPETPTFVRPNLYKSWETFSTTATPVMRGQYTKFIPHTPVEVAPRQDARYWEADLNARLYERQIITSAKEQPYANWNRRQAFINLIAQNTPSRNDPYLKKLETANSNFGCQLQRNQGIPPAVTSF